MNESTAKLINLLFEIVSTVVLPLLALMVARYVKDSKLRGALTTLNDQAALSVQRLNKSRRELKDPSRPGSWTDTEAKALKDAARREVKQALGDSIGLLIEQFGGEVLFDDKINKLIDSHAEGTRTASATPSPSGAPPAPIAVVVAVDATRTPTLPPPPPEPTPAA